MLEGRPSPNANEAGPEARLARSADARLSYQVRPAGHPPEVFGLVHARTGAPPSVLVIENVLVEFDVAVTTKLSASAP